MPDNWDFSQKPSRPRRTVDTGLQMPLMTYLMVALSTIITVAFLQPGLVRSPAWDNLGQFGLTAPWPWPMVTTIFIHGGWLHLLFNMIWLVQLGRILENTLHPLAYLGLVVGAAAVGSGCELLIPPHQTGIGMSGVVYAMIGLMWAGRSTYASWASAATPDNLRLFVLWGLFCVFTTYVPIAGLHYGVANGAHGGGFLFGLSVGYLFFTMRRHWVWAVPLVLLVGVTVFSAVWLA